MSANFAASLAFTLQQEGGFSDDPADSGGATNKGITLATFRAWSGDATLTVADLLMISDGDIAAIYGSMYWNATQCDALPTGIDLSVFDMAVNAGPARSAKLLQGALGFTGTDVDGSIGPQTLAAVGSTAVIPLLGTLAIRQDTYYQGLAGFDRFGAGWTARVNARKNAAIRLLGQAVA